MARQFDFKEREPRHSEGNLTSEMVELLIKQLRDRAGKVI